MKKIMIFPLVILLVCASFFSGCVEEDEGDGTAVGMGTLRLQITDKPSDLDIIYANVTISNVHVHKAVAGDVDDNDEEDENGEEENSEDENGNGEGFIADAGGNYSGSVGELIQFWGNASGGNGTYNWSWDFGDGNTSDEQNPQKLYDVAGVYEVNLTVTDSDNETAWDVTYAKISEDGNNNDDNGNGYAGWYTIINESQEFDLIELQDVKDVLGEQNLSAGKYTQIRLTIEKAEITINNNGEIEVHDLQIPSGNIKLTKGFWIYEDETTVLTLDFDIHKSVHKTGSNKYILQPTIKIIQE